MIDIIFAILMLLAIAQGYRKGLIVALFSIIAIVAGIAAALKLSAALAVRMQHTGWLSSKWLPFFSFVLVFLLVVFLVHLGARLIQKTFELVLLGWADRLGGALLYIVLYTIVFSVFLFYAHQTGLFDSATIRASKIYPLVEPLGPKVIGEMGKLIPLLKDTFHQLEAFFGNVSNKIEQ